ncbi:hypothetical protein DICPUDRAFT_147080 [Dictyostelium purpureum]|uniref:Transmembrane protein n=1 Tax=Dictyostelium purpureum TaxID=5786 RepID=F0Z7L8_DICPU|nr:uncharacterized protein DICPUDRAFT_147080 [Dictyostelium purpureum]EGC40085.1 hypothetical protein DICPUDRAFT_147080 [Dictyostelium purpureum]|eukprot:XP_003283434.1 hypothetical protein DICPUDRAFT_147080 [Dictyostelium purpureum]
MICDNTTESSSADNINIEVTENNTSNKGLNTNNIVFPSLVSGNNYVLPSKDQLNKYKLSKEFTCTGRFLRFDTSFQNYPIGLQQFLPYQELMCIADDVNRIVEKEKSRRIIVSVISIISYFILGSIFVYFSVINQRNMNLMFFGVYFSVFVSVAVVIVNRNKLKQIDNQLYSMESRYRNRGIIVSFKRKEYIFRNLEFKGSVYYPNSNVVPPPQIYNQTTVNPQIYASPMYNQAPQMYNQVAPQMYNQVAPQMYNQVAPQMYNQIPQLYTPVPYYNNAATNPIPNTDPLPQSQSENMPLLK